MNDCAEILARLSEPGRAPDHADLAHLEACAECRQAHAAVSALASTARAPAPEKLAYFPARVSASRVRNAPRSRLVASLSAAAATVAVALALQWSGVGSPRPESPIASQPVVASETQSVDEAWLDEAADLVAYDLVYGDDGLASVDLDALDEAI